MSKRPFEFSQITIIDIFFNKAQIDVIDSFDRAIIAHIEKIRRREPKAADFVYVVPQTTFEPIFREAMVDALVYLWKRRGFLVNWLPESGSILLRAPKYIRLNCERESDNIHKSESKDGGNTTV